MKEVKYSLAKINGSNISAELAEAMGISKSAAKAYTDFIFESIKKHVENNDDVNITKFGKFKLSITAPRKGRNIHTGENVKIPAKNKITFEMSRLLSQTYNPDYPDDLENSEIIDPESPDLDD